jgi:hypothetical protein
VVLVVPLAAEQVPVEAEGRAPVLYARREVLLYGGLEPRPLPFRQRAGLARRVYAGVEEGLVDVDVADAGDDLLVEEEALDPGPRPPSFSRR